MTRPASMPGLKLLASLSAAVVALLLAGQVASTVSLGLLGGRWSDATPWTAVQYAIYYGELPYVRNALYGGLVAVLALFAVPLIFAFAGKNEKPLHGAAVWAGPRALRASELLSGKGIIVGLSGRRFGRRFLQHNGGGGISPHVLLAAPTGSGKTQGVMIPNAYAWPGSVVLLDIKGELYAETAGYRAASGQQVYRLDFSPLDGRSHCYNPFAYVRRDPEHLAADVRRIADQLVTESKPDAIWSNGARQLFVAAALYLYGVDDAEPTLPKLREVIEVPEGFRQWCAGFLREEENRVTHHPECVIGFGRMANGPEEAMLGMLANLQDALNPLVNDQTVAVLGDNSFDLRELRTSRLSIYVTAQPKDQSQYGPLLRLFFQQLIDVNSDIEFANLPKNSAEVLIGLDEFAALGALPAIERGITVVRSYGLRLLVIVQSPAQLNTLYGREGSRTFTDNFGCAVFYTPGARDLETAEELSRLLGYTTRKVGSFNRRKHALFDERSSVSTSEQKRALLLPQEILSLPAHEAIVRISGLPPLRATKILAATDPLFVSRRMAAPLTPRLQLRDLWPGLTIRPKPMVKPPAGAADAPGATEQRARPASLDVSYQTQQGGIEAGRSAPAAEAAAARPQAGGFHDAAEFDIEQLELLRAHDFDIMFQDVVVPQTTLTNESFAALVSGMNSCIFSDNVDPDEMPTLSRARKTDVA